MVFFFAAKPGPVDDISNDSILDIFQRLVPDNIFQLIVDQTNLYATQVIAKGATQKSRIHEWKELSLQELKNFVALTILMGLDEKPSIEDYWAKRGVFYSHFYRAVMSRNRYQIIRRFLHFADNTNYDATDQNRDRLYKVRQLIELLLANFQSSYWPSKDVSIDEQLLLHKGKLVFRQYIPIKRSRFGIKIYSLCDENGYIWNSEVYTGKDTKQAEVPGLTGKTSQVVGRLMKGLLGKGHHLYVDNFYTNEQLFNYLHQNKTGACGTARKNQVKVPADFKMKKQIKERQIPCTTTTS